MKLTIRNTKGAKQPYGWTAKARNNRAVGTSGESYHNQADAIAGAEDCAQAILADPRTDDKAIIARHLAEFHLIVVPQTPTADGVAVAVEINELAYPTEPT